MHLTNESVGSCSSVFPFACRVTVSLGSRAHPPPSLALLRVPQRPRNIDNARWEDLSHMELHAISAGCAFLLSPLEALEEVLFSSFNGHKDISLGAP